ncbi:MAG: hypothetical protein ACI9YT_001932 [Halobacteriales archaeon]|jgi:hypothetical protein
MDSDSPVASRIADRTLPSSIASPLFCAMTTMRSTAEFLRDWLSNPFGTKLGSTTFTSTSRGEPRAHYPGPTGYGRSQ